MKCDFYPDNIDFYYCPGNTLVEQLEAAPMDKTQLKPCTAFEGSRLIAAGPLPAVALAVKACLDQGPNGSLLMFDDATGEVIDLDTRGIPAEVLARYSSPESDSPRIEESRGRGRPKLGVVAREVTLLPRHWDWLNAQPGGASVTLRKLVEEARRARSGKECKRQAQERTYRVMSTLGGNEPGYEEALRALYASDQPAFEACTQVWPVKVRDYVRQLAEPAFLLES